MFKLKNSIYSIMMNRKEFLRFVLVGGFGTLITYLLYLVLLKIFHYQVAYAISFVLGVLYSYFVNTLFTFQEKLNYKKFLIFPSVYFIQYLISALLLYILVNITHIPEKISPLIVVILTYPVVYLLAKRVIKSS